MSFWVHGHTTFSFLPIKHAPPPRYYQNNIFKYFVTLIGYVIVKMSLKPKVSKRLERLVLSGICSAEDALKHEAELKRLVEDVGDLDVIDEQSRFFKALSSDTRLKMLKILSVREMCVCEVMVALGLTQSTASHHLNLLENAGLVSDRKEGQWVFYSIANPQLIEDMTRLGLLWKRRMKM